MHVCVWSVNDIKETQNVFVENMKTGRAKHANPLNPPQSAAGVAPQPARSPYTIHICMNVSVVSRSVSVMYAPA